MADRTSTQYILVKARPGLKETKLALGRSSVNVRVEPLFRSIGQDGALGAAAGDTTWYAFEPSVPVDQPNLWDLCHSLVQNGLGVADGAIEFAEPDLQQQWIVGEEAGLGIATARTCAVAQDQDQHYPTAPDPLWFRDADHSQFDAALAARTNATGAAGVRVAHLDTGYDAEHRTLPRRLNKVLQRNFVDAGRPDDASDDTTGPFNNLGHGTGTLGILAGSAPDGGKPIGAAPDIEVVPIRVANRVVLFYNSAIAKAFDYVHGLCRDPATRIHVITMSMGGLASQAWADAVNALYEAGVFVVTAAGNNFGNLPTRNIVYPARFGRVIAACGVMENHQPYADLDRKLMAGNYGPESKMKTALSACTPNLPWARLGCPQLVDHNGSGTSSATPQIAATAALWIQRNLRAWEAYPEGWMRVAAVRHALFSSAHAIADEERWLGQGELRARDALNVLPAKASELHPEPADNAHFPLLRTLAGLGIEAETDPKLRMLELEALQLSQSADLEAVLPDPALPPEAVTRTQLQQLAEALAAQPGASTALRDALGAAERKNRTVVALPPTLHPITNSVEKLHLEHAIEPRPPVPARRPLRVYAYDPSLATRIETFGINEATIEIPWEDLEPGPVGEYIEVVDVDPASGCCYAPVDLNHPHLLTQNGLAPSEGNPQFHQQMAYAVAMQTIERFERALGRKALWAPRRLRGSDGHVCENRFVRRLRIYPHALRMANAFYSPDRKALLLGYFSAAGKDPANVLPGGLVFGALSHDIVAHETTHALLDGLHRRFSEPTNPDVLAFHEAFADIVALFQHFTIKEALRHQIRRTRGDLQRHSLLAELAVEFGQATQGGYGALRDAIGKFEEKDGKQVWTPHEPGRNDYEGSSEPHARGSVLVSAVFAAFLQIYRSRAAEFVRLATGGSGILPEGEIPEFLADRLTEEAGKVAGHVLTMCIRALDYCPPVDLRFGEYLRALITADRDIVPNDTRGYRVAFVSAFRDRGIYPSEVKHLSEGSLIWEPPPLPLRNIDNVLRDMTLTWDLNTQREVAYHTSEDNARKFWHWLRSPHQVPDDELTALGFFRDAQDMSIGDVPGKLGGIEVHSVRPARRIGPDGQSRTDLVVELTQTFRPSPPKNGTFRGGCTLLINLEETNPEFKVRYFVRKRVGSPDRIQSQQNYTQAITQNHRATYFDDPDGGREPFALLHQHRYA